jgi:LPS O-antigen subunit length determinant protein (WzzB/FepE family)
MSVLRRSWWKVACMTAVITAIYSVYALRKPSLYTAKLTVLVPARYSPTRLVAKELGMPPELDIGSARIDAVFRSNELVDAVIARFALMKRYGFANGDLARETVRDMCQVTQEIDLHLVVLACDSDDPALAKAIADFMGDEGSRIYRRISQSVASHEHAFLESRVEVARRDRDAAHEQLQAFQREHRVIDIEAQTKLITAALGQLEADKLRKDVELAYQRGFAADGAATIQQLEHQLAAIEKQIHELEEGAPPTTSSDSILVPATAVPALELQLHALERESIIREAVFESLLQRQELARIAEGRDTASFDVLAPASLPTISERPRRAVIIGAGVFGGIMLGFAWLLLPGWWRRQSWYVP